MFDVGLSEMMVILVVALIVIGPERLPKVARTLGHLWGRMQRYVSGIKSEISRDMAMEEMRKMRDSVEQEVSSISQTASSMAQQLDQEVSKVNEVLVESVSAAPSPTDVLRQRAREAAAQQKLPID